MPCDAAVDMDLWRILGEVLHWPAPFRAPQLCSGLVQTEDLAVCDH